MRKVQLWFALLAVVGIAAIMQVSCGSSTMTSSKGGGPVGPPIGSGSVLLMGGDAPVCDVMSFKVTITAANLTSASGSASASLIDASSPVTVDFARLMNFATFLNLGSAPAGTYSTLSLTLANAQLTVLDLTKTPPQPLQVPTTLSSSNITISLNPPLVINSGATSGLQLDFNLLRSVQVDSNGQVTGAVNPVITTSSSAAGGAGGAGTGELDDLAGIVQSVSTKPTSTFIGSITLQNSDGKIYTVEVTSSTIFETASGLGAIQPNMLVEINAIFSDAAGAATASGAIVAKEVAVEPTDGASLRAYAGFITSVTRDSTGNATQFTMIVRDELPTPDPSVPPLSAVTVSVSSSTQFKLTSESTDGGGINYASNMVGPGQEVMVHAAPAQASGAVTTLAAQDVYLRVQSLLGNFSKLLGSPSDNIQGGFTFIPCEPLLGAQPMPVFTFENTQFTGVSGLSQLTPQPTLVVTGLLFYMPSAVTINGIAVQPPTMLFEASGVEQLP